MFFKRREIELRTERLVLRRLQPKDASSLVSNANDWDVVRMLTQLPYPYTLDDAKAYIRAVKRQRPRDFGVFLDDTLIGCCGAEHHLGYHYGRAYWGRGYATEAATAALDDYFASTDAPFIASGAFEDNEPSRHVLAKLGFVEIGRAPRFSKARRTHATHIDMRLERKAWLERRSDSVTEHS